MAASKPAPHEVLRESARRARLLADKVGREKTRQLLAKAQKDLEERLRARLGESGDPGSFNVVRMRSALEQVRHVTRDLKQGMGTTVLDATARAAPEAAKRTLQYLRKAQARFSEAVQPLRLDEAALSDDAAAGARASILRRIATDPAHPGQPGVLDRYGAATIGEFEGHFRVAVATGASVDELVDQVTESSDFLRGKPAYWAERLVRTETMAGHNAANLESIRSAHEQLGDMLKILSCTLDERTGADSIDVHGQVRRVDEEFDTWFGSVMAPPDRPNDRAVVVPHRIAWGPPPSDLKPYPRSMVLARWSREKRRGSPPARPTESTVKFER